MLQHEDSSKASAIVDLYNVFVRAASFLPSGVVIVTAIDVQGAPFGFTASTFCAVSCKPALITVSVARDAPRLAALRQCARFGISVLSESQAHLAKRLGTPGAPRFDDSSYYAIEAGVPIIPGAVLHCICESKQILPAGDHCLLLAAVVGLAMPGGNPLVYWRRAFFRLQLEYPFLTSAAALHDFIQNWHGGALPRTAWTHAAHIAVTAYYAFGRSPEELLPIMREGIVRFNDSVGVDNGPDSGYHETLTRFWCNILSSLVHRGTFESPFTGAREAIVVFGEDRDLHNLYYSFDVVRCRQARRQWIPPDREPSARWYSTDSLICE